MRPVIGVTARLRDMTGSAGLTSSYTVNRNYTSAVTRAGGIPLVLAPLPAADAAAVADRMDGLMLTGGGDVNPARYGGHQHESVYDVDDDRDEFEFALVAEAATRRLPTLAICRGLQVLNVALGGSLVTDIPSQVAGALPHSRTGEHVYERFQPVALAAGCRLAELLGTALSVNSIHHQSVDRPAPGLRVVGQAGDGVVEAVEPDDAAWPVWAVQWHPEYLAERDDTALRLFQALVDAAGG